MMGRHIRIRWTLRRSLISFNTVKDDRKQNYENVLPLFKDECEKYSLDF